MSAESAEAPPAKVGPYLVVTIMPLGGFDMGSFGSTGRAWPVLGCQICGALVPADAAWADHPDLEYPHANAGHTRWHESMGQRWPS